jgi:hypothetical protein
VYSVVRSQTYQDSFEDITTQLFLRWEDFQIVDEFRKKVESYFDRIADNPKEFKEVSRAVRAFIFEYRGIRYGVVYHISGYTVQILDIQFARSFKWGSYMGHN